MTPRVADADRKRGRPRTSLNSRCIPGLSYHESGSIRRALRSIDHWDKVHSRNPSDTMAISILDEIEEELRTFFPYEWILFKNAHTS